MHVITIRNDNTIFVNLFIVPILLSPPLYYFLRAIFGLFSLNDSILLRGSYDRVIFRSFFKIYKIFLSNDLHFTEILNVNYIRIESLLYN